VLLRLLHLHLPLLLVVVLLLLLARVLPFPLLRAAALRTAAFWLVALPLLLVVLPLLLLVLPLLLVLVLAVRVWEVKVAFQVDRDKR
jgi:hypothetical protein